MKIELKESWEQVTLSEYLAYDKVLRMDLEGRPHHKQCLMLECISDATYEDILKAPRAVYKQMVETAMFLTVPPIQNPCTEFKVGDTDYMIIDYNQMSAGESISLEQILIREKETGVSQLAEMLAIMIRPIVRNISTEFKDANNKCKIIETAEPFDIDKLEDRAKLFLNQLTVPNLVGFLTTSLIGGTPLGKTIKKSLAPESNTMSTETPKKNLKQKQK
jgi:hypothetical protein